MDVRIPEMLHAVVKQSQIRGGTLTQYNKKEALNVKGVNAVVPIPSQQITLKKYPEAIAVVAESNWQALKGMEILKPSFKGGDTLNLSSTKIETIFKASPSRKTAAHYGAKMAFLDDGTLLITSGDGFNYRESAQYLDNHYGKIIRINSDGSIPSDNPFLGNKDAMPEIWSYGHRNLQGIVVVDGIVYELSLIHI